MLLNDYNIFQLVALGCTVLSIMLYLAITLGWVFSKSWRWVNRDDSTKTTWVSQQLLNLWQEKDEEVGLVAFVTVALIMIVPQLVTLGVVYWQYVAPIVLFIALMHMTRAGFDYGKLFTKHVKDVNAHKAEVEVDHNE